MSESAFPVVGAHRFSDATDLTTYGVDNEACWDLRASGTVSYAADPVSGDRKVLRLDGSAGESVVYFKRASRSLGTPNSAEIDAFSESWYAGRLHVAAAALTGGTGRLEVALMGNSTSSGRWRLEVYPDGALGLNEGGGGPSIKTSAGAVTLGQWVSVRWKIKTGGAGAGRLVLSYYDGVSDDPDDFTDLDSGAISVNTESLQFIGASSDQAGTVTGTSLVEWDWIGSASRLTLDAGLTDDEMWARCAYDPFYAFGVREPSASGATLHVHAQADEYDTTDVIRYSVHDAADGGGSEVDTGSVAVSALDATYRNAFEAVTGLSADTQHSVRFTVTNAAGSVTRATSGWFNFKTLPSTGAQPRTIRLAVVTQHMSNGQRKPYTAYQSLLAYLAGTGESVDLFVSLGKLNRIDNNGDRAPATTEAKVYQSHRQGFNDALRVLGQMAAAWLHIQNDYDAGPTNWGGYYDGSATTVASQDTTYDYDNTGSGGDRGDQLTLDQAHTLAVAAWDGLFKDGFDYTQTATAVGGDGVRSFAIGARTRLVLVEERQFRDDPAGESPSCLGSTQLAELKAELAAATEDIILVAFATQPGREDNPTDAFGGAYFAERNDLLDDIVANVSSDKKVVFVGSGKTVPSLTETLGEGITGAEGSAIGPCVLACPTAGRANGYTDADFVDTGVLKTGVRKVYRALPDEDSEQNDIVDPVTGATQGFADADNLAGVTLIDINEATGAMRVRVVDGWSGSLLSDNLAGDFDDTIALVAASSSVPVLGTPVVAALTDTTAGVAAATTVTTGVVHGVVTDSATAPSVAQIKAGQDHTGSDADAHFDARVEASGFARADFAGLTDETAYYAHLVQTDAGGGVSNVATTAEFTTAAIPAVTGRARNSFL